jgi:hypothetical protein
MSATRIKTRDPKPVNRDPIREQFEKETSVKQCDCGSKTLRRRGTLIDPCVGLAVDYFDCAHCNKLHRRMRVMTQTENAEFVRITGGPR